MLGAGIRGGRSRGGKGVRGGAIGRGRGGARGGRDNEKGPRRSRNKAEHGGDSITAETIKNTPQETRYLTEKAQREMAVPIPYNPADISPEALVGGGPAVIVGQWGMSEVVEERLNRLAPTGLTDAGTRRQDLARELLRGNVVRFKDEEEKNDVLAMAESIAIKEAELKSEEKGELIESKFEGFEPFDDEWKVRLLTNMLKGEYRLAEEAAKEGDPPDLVRNTIRNETYLPKNEASLAAKVRSLVGVQSNRPRVKKTA